MADYLVQEGGAATDRLTLESGELLLLEDGSDILLESSTTGGTGRFTLEDGTGFILLESGVPPPPTPEVVTGGRIFIPRRRLSLRTEGLEEDEAIALSILISLNR